MAGGAYFAFRYVCKNLYQFIGQDLFTGKGHERIQEAHVRIPQRLDVVFDVLCIGSDDRAVIVIDRTREFIALIGDAGIENEADALRQQPFDVTVRYFGRITGRITGDGFDAQLVDLPGRSRREDYFISQPGKEGKPERIVLIHVQDARDPDFAARRRLRIQRRIVEQPLVFVFKQIRNVPGILFFAESAFAPVAADIPASSGKQVDGQTAAVRAALAVGHFGRVFQCVDLIDRQHGGRLACKTVPGDQSSAKGTHDTGNIRADGLTVRNTFKTAQHRIVIKGAALHHDMMAEFSGIGHFNDFVQGVFDDGVGKTGGDIGNGRAFFLRLLYLGIHENRAAGAQVDRVLGKQGFFGKILYGIVQGLCEVFNKGTAAGRAGFVQQDAFHSVVFDLDAFHVLAADIQDTVHIRIKESGGGIMGDRLHFSFIEEQCGLDQFFAVTGRTCVDDMGFLRHVRVDFLNGADRSGQRISLIVGIERMQEGAVFTDKGCFGRRGAGIDPEIAVAAVGGQISCPYVVDFLPFQKTLIVLPGGEERLHAGNFHFHFDPAAQAVFEFRQIHHSFRIGVQSRTEGGEQMGIVRNQSMFVIQMQGTDETGAEFREEMQRSPEEDDMPPDRFAAGQSGNGLVDDSLENGNRQIFLGGSFVDQRLDIRLGEDAAARSDRIDGLVVFGIFVQPGRICLQQGSHLVDERTGAAGADTVHALLNVAVFKIDDLGIFSAQFDRHIRLRGEEPDGRRDGNNFLCKRNLQIVRQRQAAAPGDHGEQLAGSQFFFCFLQQVGQGFLNPGEMPFIIRKKQLVFFIDNGYFYGCGTDINTQCISLFCHELLLVISLNGFSGYQDAVTASYNQNSELIIR